ncbi:MAG: hypothetical protein ACKOWF_05755, partial [Chloroflexota bacterium]
MDHREFDRITRAFAGGWSRRAALRLAAAGILSTPGIAAAGKKSKNCKKANQSCGNGKKCCDGLLCCKGACVNPTSDEANCGAACRGGKQCCDG